MPNYSGILGTPLGDFQLGESVIILGACMTQEAVEVVYTGDAYALMTQMAVELFYQPNPNLRVSQEVVEIVYVRPPSLRMTQQPVEVLDKYTPSIRTTQVIAEILETRTPSIRLTQLGAEVVQVRDAFCRLTQDAVEVLYQSVTPLERFFTHNFRVEQSIAHSSLVNRTVISAIHVGQGVGGGTYPLTVNSPVTVTQTIAFYRPVKHLSANASILVTQTIFHYEPVKHISLGSTVTVNQTIVQRNATNRQTINSPITVQQTITRESNTVDKSVSSTITVTSEIFIRDRIANVTVDTTVTVTPTIAFRNTVVRISVSSDLGATQGSDAHNTFDRLEVSDEVTVSSIVFARNTNVEAEVFSTLTISTIASGRSTIIHKTFDSAIDLEHFVVIFNPNLSVSSLVHVTQLISFHSSAVPISVDQSITVSQAIRNDPNQQVLNSAVHVDGSGFGTAIKIYVTPVRWIVVQPVYLSTEVTGGSSDRYFAMSSPITVSQDVRHSFPAVTVISPIQVSHSIIGGGSNREISLSDSLVVGQSIVTRNTISRQSIHHPLVLIQTIVNTTNEIPILLDQEIIADSEVDFRLLRLQKMHNDLHIDQGILSRPDNNRQTVNSAITVTQGLRSSPNYQTIQTAIAVSTSIRQLEQVVVHRIHVDQTINITRTRLVIQKLPITQVLTVNRNVSRLVESEVTVSSTIKANHVYVRSITQKLILPETDYLLPLSFHNNPLVVPVVIGVIVNEKLMTIRSGSSVILLPPAQLGDRIEGIGKIAIRRSMDGTSFSYVQQTDRQRLVYKWLLPHLKIYEFAAFVERNLSELLMIENWKGEIWAAKITKNPFQFENKGVWELAKEFAEVQVEFEGRKVG